MGDDEENEWTSSNITGYDFGDDDQVKFCFWGLMHGKKENGVKVFFFSFLSP